MSARSHQRVGWVTSDKHEVILMQAQPPAANGACLEYAQCKCGWQCRPRRDQRSVLKSGNQHVTETTR